MPAGNTYEAIATAVGTGSSTSITFSSIPSTYTDLVLVCNVIVPSSSSIAIQFNSDTGNNYSYTVLDGDGTTASSNRQTNVNVINLAGWSSNLGSTTNPSPILCSINNYSNSTTYKTALVRSAAYGTSSSCVDAFVGTWRNTSIITSIRVFSSSANLATTSTFSLYGIKAA
jgi:hypothetical protein